MSELEIVLVRHGRTAWNAQRRFLGRTDLPLDDVGHAQALALADDAAVRAEVVICSPLARARQTAGYLHPDPTPDASLAEIDQGELEGMDGRSAMARFPEFFADWGRDPTHATVPGGESLGACRDRAWSALQRWADVHARAGRVVVVSHQLVIASVCATVDGAPLTAWTRYGVPPTGRRRLRVTPSKWTLQDPPD